MDASSIIEQIDSTGFSPETLSQTLTGAAPVQPPKGHRPWHDWTNPTVLTSPLHMLRLDTRLDEDSRQTLVLANSDGRVGTVTHGLLTGLAEFTTFPSEFIEKLSPRLAAAVVNERIQGARTMDCALVVSDGSVNRLTEGSREIVPASLLAEFVDDWGIEQFGSAEVTEATYDGTVMRLWLNVPLEAPVTRQAGDVLRAGFVVEQEYGEPIRVSLGAVRLICTNGMTANSQLYSWRCKDSRDVDSQLAWVGGALDGCYQSFLPLVERAQRMAESRFSGDYHAVLRNSARAMRLPNRYIGALIAAFEEEPGDTHWHLANSFTRLATHSAMPARVSASVMHAAGDWTARFQLVHAELPGAMATLVGARILDRDPRMEHELA